MAVVVDHCSSPPLPLTPPHPSFSKESSPLHLDANPTTTSSDFHFHTPTTTTSSSSSTAPADVLFANGKLLPLNHFTPTPPPQETKKKEEQQHRLKELISTPHDEPTKTPSSPNKPRPSSSSSSFWRFSRSIGVNHKPVGLTCSLHLLPRSKSAGSSSSSSSNPKQQQQQRRSSSMATTEPKCLRKSSSVPKAAPLASSYYYGGSRKGVGGGGMRINPVLNVSGGGFFGFGYLFCGAREKGSAGATKKKPSLFSV